LRKRVCISSPPAARAAPANRAVTAFRSLILRMMSLVAGSQEPPVSAAQTSPNGTATDPTARSAMKSAAVSSPSAVKRNVVLRAVI